MEMDLSDDYLSSFALKTKCPWDQPTNKNKTKQNQTAIWY